MSLQQAMMEMFGSGILGFVNALLKDKSYMLHSYTGIGFLQARKES